MIERAVDAGFPKVEVTSFSHPKLLSQFADAVDVLKGLHHRPGASYVVLMPNEKGWERFETCQKEGYGADEIILMISSSEKHNLLNFRLTIDDAMTEHAAIMKRAHERGIRIIGCAGTVYGCPVRGDLTTDEVARVVRSYLDEGAQTIMLGDTTGVANPRLVRERVGELMARFPGTGRDVTVESLGHRLDGQSMRITGSGGEVKVNMPLLGMDQMQNAATAAAALWEMQRQGVALTKTAVLDGFERVRWPARFEIARREPPVIFESAHIQDSFAWLRQSLDDYFPGRPVYLVFGASEDKNIPGMFAEIRGKLRCIFITRADHPRALAPESILPLATGAGIRTELLEPVAAAFERALGLSEKDGSIVLSAGSMFVTAEAIAAWQARDRVDARQQL